MVKLLAYLGRISINFGKLRRKSRKFTCSYGLKEYAISPPLGTIYACVSIYRHNIRGNEATTVKLLLTLLIFVATLVGILVRPWRLNEGTAALLGGLLVLLTGLVTLPDAAGTLLADWNVFFFFLGMMALSALAEQAGFFDWASVRVARLVGGNQRRLLVGVMLLGAAISTLLSNDATALILTPIVFTLTKRLNLDPLPYTFACVFIADTASFILPVSNPINIILLNSFHLSLGEFFRLFLLPSIVVITLNILILLWIFRRRIRDGFDAGQLGDAMAGVRDPAYFRFVLVVLGLVAVAYLGFSLAQWPLSLVALGGAGLLLIGGLARRTVTAGKVAEQISWPIFGFIAGMALVVRAVEQIGLVQRISGVLLHIGGASAHPSLALVGATTLGAAAGSNLINNIPMAFLMTAALHHVGRVARQTRLALVGSTILGCDLGANLTTVGSLAKVFWLLLLRQRGVQVSALDYLKLGLVVTPPLLLIGGFLLWALNH